MTDAHDPLLTRLRDRCVGAVMYAPIGLSKLLPYRWRVPFMGWVTSRVVSPIAGYDKRIRKNLAHVLPDLPEAEIRRLIRTVPDMAGRTMIEMYSAREFTERARHSPIDGPGMDAVRKCQAEGRPLIFVTGHFGSYNAARVAMINEGIKMGGFYRPMKNRYFNVHYINAMKAISEPLFEQGRTGMVQMVRHLRRGGVLAILTDLNAHDGVPLSFFGKPALSSLATAELALKFNAPLVPVWGIRAENGLDFSVYVEDPITPSDPATMTQEVNNRLETQVRRHMDQWFWIHRRWKDGTGILAERGAQRLDEMGKN